MVIEMKKVILLIAATTLLSLSACAFNPNRVDGVTFTVQPDSIDGELTCHYVYDPAKVRMDNLEQIAKELRAAYASKIDKCTRFINQEAKPVELLSYSSQDEREND
jgi:hypothetical protein